MVSFKLANGAQISAKSIFGHGGLLEIPKFDRL